MSRYKIAVAGLIHETNTFTPTPTTYADFDLFGSSPPILRGEKILSTFRDVGSSMGGILDALRRADVEIVPLLWCAAQPGGIVEGETFERLLNEIITALKAAGPVDAVILDLHGAMVVETSKTQNTSFWIAYDMRPVLKHSSRRFWISMATSAGRWWKQAIFSSLTEPIRISTWEKRVFVRQPGH